LLMGLTFKENCPDIRNTKVVDIIDELRQYGVNVDVYDPWVNKQEALHEYGVEVIDQPKQASYEGVIVAVAHNEFKSLGIEGIKALAMPTHVVYDLKYIIDANSVDIRL